MDGARGDIGAARIGTRARKHERASTAHRETAYATVDSVGDQDGAGVRREGARAGQGAGVSKRQVGGRDDGAAIAEGERARGGAQVVGRGDLYRAAGDGNAAVEGVGARKGQDARTGLLQLARTRDDAGQREGLRGGDFNRACARHGDGARGGERVRGK